MKKISIIISLLSVIYSTAYTLEPPPRAVDTSYIFMTEGLTFYQLGDFNNAEKTFRKAVTKIKTSGKPNNPNLGYCYVNLGAINMMLWKNDLALEYYDSARVFLHGLYGENHFSYASVLLNIGNIYFRTRDIKRAEEYYQQALTILQGFQKTRDVTTYIATVNNNLGLLYEHKGNFTQALKYYDEAIIIRENTDKQNLTNSLRNKAVCLRKLGRYAEAELIHLRNIRVTKEILGENHYSLGLIYVSYGFLLSQSFKQFENAKRSYQKAIDIFRLNFGDKHPYISNAYLNIGKVYIADGNPGAAVECFQKSLIALVPGFNETDPRANPAINEVPSLIEFLETLKEKGKAFEMIALKNNESWPLVISINSFELATEVIDKIRKGYQSEESKLYLSENQNAIFHDAIRVCYKLSQITSDRKYLEKALFFAEKNKAVNLLASIRQVGAREFGRIPSSLVKEENDLKRQIALYNEYIYEEGRKLEPDLERQNLWQQKLFELGQDYSEMINLLENDYPDYYRLKYNSTVSGLKEIRRNLGRKDAIIEYSLSDSIIYIFFVTRSDFELIEQRIDDGFRNDIDNILDIFEKKRFASGVAQDFNVFTSSSNHLYNTLIKPLEHWLNGQNLIIIPDGILSYLPFELLISGLPARAEPAYSKLPFLLRNHAVSYVHSATLMNEYTAVSDRKGGRVMAFAPQYDPDGISIPDLLNARSHYRDNLKPLPASKIEVMNILKMVGGKLWIDEQATERNFKENAANYNILHLAMHTLIDDRNPMFSKLVFTHDNDSLEDGLLNTYEIYNLSLSANMAVLSSCKSGWGKFQTGEGVLSLARGFLYAGVPSIVMTLWEIEDQSSADVMTLFYKYLKKGKRKDEALRLAKLEFLDNADMLKSHPYFWGGYVTIGDNNPVFFHKWIKYGLFASIFILVLTFASFYRRKKRYPFNQY